MKSVNCDFCKKRKRIKDLKTLTKDSIVLQRLRKLKKSLPTTAHICSRCCAVATKSLSKHKRNRKLKKSNNQTTDSVEADNLVTENERITIDFPSTSKTSRCCIICNSNNGRCKIPKQAKLDIFIKRGILVQEDNRVCKRHLVGGFIKEEDIVRIPIVSTKASVHSKEVNVLLQNLRVLCQRKCLDFDTVGTLSDEDYYRLTGLHKQQFNDLMTYISGINNTENRSSRMCIALLLIKLRTNMSHSVLSTIFGVKKRIISRSIAKARTVLINDFVPKHLGMQHISRDDIIRSHTRELAKHLFSDNKDVAILIADGTYIYIQKSSDYSFQRRSYSVYKGRPLLKPMMFVSTTGYILDVFGPYYADNKNNDANIMISLKKELTDWFQTNDVIVVDRGFRDSLSLLEECNLIPKMPHFLEKGLQHSTEEANESRLVTSIRWVVEAINGLIKTWKMLNDVLPNSQIPYAGEYVRIVSALCNAYRPPRIQSRTDHDEIVANRMLALSKQSNELQKIVVEKGWARKRVIWQQINSDSLPDFPRLSIEDLRFITIGVYQIKQAVSYTREHLADDGLYTIEMHKDRADILRVKIQSRHTSAKQYWAWIQYEVGLHPIKNWYCQCKTGARTVGCCAHVASILWYLGYYRHQAHDNKTSNYCETFHNYVLDSAGHEDNPEWTSSESDNGESDRDD